MKKFFKEFKEFISRGNIVDLAVAVIIGGAFSAIVTAFTNKIIMPFVNLALSGGSSLDSAYTILKGVYDEENNLILESSIYIDWGAFITAVINFLIIALTLFVIVKVMNSSAKKLQQLKGGIVAQTDKELIAEKKAVKAQAEKDGKSFKEAWAEHLKQKELEAEEEKKRKEAEEAEQKAKERAENPTQEDLLKEIRDLLKSQNKND